MRGDLEIYATRSEDIDDFYAALSSVVNEGRFLLMSEPPSLEQVRAFILANIENNSAQYVARIDGRLVGWADIVPSQRSTMTHGARLGMGIVCGHRRQGIGSALLSTALSHAWQTGLKRIELEVFADNEVAIHLYKTNGFNIEGTKRFARYSDEHYQDIVQMAQYRI
ncbi:L-amino acid N-acetyltransferase AaaT [BD1-7 clade bacterium]|uniref:L-amino acid N-acetyltransferase AaaT n=1 Tax=BD1-7 clade bacterium TaxID=2029982 RepID=A0A5S9PLU3_9GAMM|nr:L-amino acid N-acetyltransferase AaaT [BD1-7 clade bacterium]